MKNKKFDRKQKLSFMVVLLSMSLGLTACATESSAAESSAAESSVAESTVAESTVAESTVASGVTDDTASAPVKVLDTPEIIADMEKARELAGDDQSLIYTQRLQSRDLDENGVPTEAPGVNTDGSETYIEPIQLFDNLYYVGGSEVGSFIFTTSEGYIMIDSGYSYSPEKLIIPGMEELGLDPSQIKYILITHAGPDHIGGAKYFQENYGTHIVMSGEEWDQVSKMNDRPKDESKEAPKEDSQNENYNIGDMMSITYPDKDIVATDGQQITLGDTTITMVHTPRKVDGGGYSYIAPVYDNGEPHMFATYGNTNVVGTLEDKQVYRDSVAHFLTFTDAANVDVVISDHPFVDGSVERMEELQNRKEGDPNPFVFTQERARRFFEVLDQCAVVLTDRQKAGLDETGTKYLDQ